MGGVKFGLQKFESLDWMSVGLVSGWVDSYYSFPLNFNTCVYSIGMLTVAKVAGNDPISL